MNEKKYRLLAVDDEQDILDMVRILLRKSPFEVITASSAQEALEKVEDNVINIVLLDIMMPEVSGLSVVGNLRARPRLSDVPIVVLTALDDYPTRRRAMEAGADDLLTKPVSRDELVAKLMGVIGERSTGSAANSWVG